MTYIILVAVLWWRRPVVLGTTLVRRLHVDHLRAYGALRTNLGHRKHCHRRPSVPENRRDSGHGKMVDRAGLGMRVGSLLERANLKMTPGEFATLALALFIFGVGIGYLLLGCWAFWRSGPSVWRHLTFI
jgi:hypothetical protein